MLGVVSFSQSATPVDMYISLSEAQKLAGDSGKVNTIYVKADSASDISSVQSKIEHLMPTATVTTAQDLANQVTGATEHGSQSGRLARGVAGCTGPSGRLCARRPADDRLGDAAGARVRHSQGDGLA